MKSAASVTVLILAFAAPAFAEGPPKNSLEGQSDIAFDVGVSDFLVTRVITRMVLGELATENRGEAHLGLGIRHDEIFSFDLTGGYAYSHGGPSPGNALVIGLWKDAAFHGGAYRFHYEGLHRYDGKYRYDGLYQFDYWVTGVHVMNRGKDVAAGFQLGSGQGLGPVRMGVMLSFGITNGMPDRSGRWFVNFDFR
jgi:hypothetical protein